VANYSRGKEPRKDDIVGQITTYGNPEKSEHDKRAEAERLREYGPKPVHIPAPKPVIEGREEKQARLDELMAEHRKGVDTSYRGLKMLFAPIWKDQERCLEAGKLAGELGISNPLTTTMMGVGEGAGVPQDRIHLFDLICDRLKRQYRANGIIDKDKFEGI
jgi:hypothetical protein